MFYIVESDISIMFKKISVIASKIKIVTEHENTRTIQYPKGDSILQKFGELIANQPRRDWT